MRVLIPSSSGQSFNLEFAHRCSQRVVLIPSSSGQSFNPYIADESILLGLNPFFIRSIVQSGELIAYADGDCCLNPFFIRSIVQSGENCNISIRSCLNHFFIRSIVQSQALAAYTRQVVLIPSSSGQSFNLESVLDAYDEEVLIPSSSGQSFNRTPAVTTHPVSYTAHQKAPFEWRSGD